MNFKRCTAFYVHHVCIYIILIVGERGHGLLEPNFYSPAVYISVITKRHHCMVSSIGNIRNQEQMR